uniref:Threonine synthase-like 2 n=1 Tax=Monopterus albus TaxID=43700 RepID=A0A3Q3JY57_MONAL
MQYCSTRGGVHGWNFRDVLFSGYAPDGGMFMPESVPVLTPDTLRSWRGLTYTKLVVEVASLFIPSQQIPRQDLEVLVGEALSSFSVPEVVRIARLNKDLSILELFHGETLAFKDLAMTCTVHILEYFVRKENSRATILVGTSGDTGGSAIQSVKGLSGLDVVVVYPRDRVTPVQEKHMITCLEDNVHVFAADGTSDDIDQRLRRIFADQELVKSHGLMSLNSVNWSRVMIQLAHFIYAYLELSGLELGEADAALPELEVVVPTGGAGNIAGRLITAAGRLITAVRTFTGLAANVIQTLASAVDVHDPYNLERVFWLLLDRDGTSVKNMMEEFQQLHRHTLPENQRKLLSQVISTGTVTDEGILETMRRCWEENHYMLCPHTAVAVWHHYHCPHSPGLNRCYVATASPAKFQAAVQRAGLTIDLPEAVRSLDKLATRYQNLERSLNWCRDWEEKLREKIQSVGSFRKGQETNNI